MKKAILAMTILALAGLACNAMSDATSIPPTQPSLPTDALQPPSGQSLFEDDFSDPTTGWPVDADSGKAASYSDGQYLISAFSVNQDVWAPYPEGDLGDVRVEVDAVRSFGPEVNSFGIVCRFVDNDNFYFLVISSHGYQAIGKYQAGQLSYLSSEQMEQASGINLGNASNHIRADCIGSTLTLYANGQMISSVTDASFPEGEVGLIVGTFDEPNVGVLFDNLIIYKP